MTDAATHVFATMGTTVSIRFANGGPERQALERVEQVFASFDREFSLYDPMSPLSAVARGELTLAESGDRVLDAYATAIDWRNATAGAFTPHRPDGVVDLSGVVKALAIAEAGVELDRLSGSWLLNVGGDVLARGSTAKGQPWRVGIVDPEHRDRLAGVAELTGARRALATSGVAERGEHVWRHGDDSLVQVTIAADDIVTADVLATAILSGGLSELDRLTAAHAVDVLVFDREGEARATPGAREWVSPDPATRP
ncbi:FAD:protein FMN transferase [Frondihabitans australicus]|uniref:FAD:protein FMN transferase n=1 Tax=Frondihabitans australicus TaxID=386892 RepID=A0A495IHF0_9MICO|nr:FAD:protein FMN transferase [Frondihabitans australicus]RKR75374.1 thiamine biosynthesis lipoprotein [Frondihabitans australicus]